MTDRQKLIDENWSHAHSDVKKGSYVLVSILVLIIVIFVNIIEVNAMTQFYIALPDIIQDLDDVTLSVEISDYKDSPVVSWTHNGSIFVPDNKTTMAEPNYDHLHLGNNDFLLAISDDIEPGTRLYICADIAYPIEQFDCQWDAVDKDRTGRAEFDFFFQSHRDNKR